MGCGCRGGGRPRPSIGPSSNNNNNNILNARKLRLAERASNSANPNITGMSKEQRDTERKKRIQAIIAKRSGQ